MFIIFRLRKLIFLPIDFEKIQKLFQMFIFPEKNKLNEIAEEKKKEERREKLMGRPSTPARGVRHLIRCRPARRIASPAEVV
jgi:hypothetical protein